MESSVSAKDEIWFLRVCHHISNAVYQLQHKRGHVVSTQVLEEGEKYYFAVKH
jgi:hypothetical protein